MLFNLLALAAASASFVIVPGVSEHDENIFKTLPVSDSTVAVAHGIPKSAFSQSLSVPCSECKGRNTYLRLDFTVEDETKLLLNGFELYPDADPWSGDLHASTVKGNGGHSRHGRHRKHKGHRQHKGDKESTPKTLGYSLAVYPKALAKDDNMELIEVDLKIIEVGTRFVDGVPAVKIELIKAPGGSLLMSAVDYDRSAGAPCTSVWCRAKHFADKLWMHTQKFKECGKQTGHNSHNSHSRPTSTVVSDYDVANVEYIPVVSEPRVPSREEWRQLVRIIAGYIIMPIVMGVTSGVAVAL